jgi:hypothetical protein
MKPPAKQPGTDPANEVCTIRMELRDSKPVIWREIEVPTSITFKVLHETIQIVMDWSDYHLWEFNMGDQRFGPPMDNDWGGVPRKNAAKVRLRELLGSRKTLIDYTYDFGDNWEVRLAVSDVRQGDANQFYPRLVRGEWAAPPEDCGGIPGFYELLDALADPKHPDHADASEQFEGYDPGLVDLNVMNFALGRIANRRMAAQATAAKRKPGAAKPTNDP